MLCLVYLFLLWFANASTKKDERGKAPNLKYRIQITSERFLPSGTVWIWIHIHCTTGPPQVRQDLSFLQFPSLQFWRRSRFHLGICNRPPPPHKSACAWLRAQGKKELSKPFLISATNSTQTFRREREKVASDLSSLSSSSFPAIHWYGRDKRDVGWKKWIGFSPGWMLGGFFPREEEEEG